MADTSAPDDPETIEYAVPRALERDLEHERSRGDAMSSAIKVTRLHPEFRSWLRGYPSGDTAHDAVVRAWLDERAIRWYLGERYGRQAPERAAALAEDAYQYLADEEGRLDAALAYVRASDTWARLPRSSRLLYEVAYGLAREPGPGGLCQVPV